jgi:hypothetical protein
VLLPWVGGGPRHWEIKLFSWEVELLAEEFKGIMPDCSKGEGVCWRVLVRWLFPNIFWFLKLLLLQIDYLLATGSNPVFILLNLSLAVPVVPEAFAPANPL